MSSQVLVLLTYLKTPHFTNECFKIHSSHFILIHKLARVKDNVKLIRFSSCLYLIWIFGIILRSTPDNVDSSKDDSVVIENGDSEGSKEKPEDKGDEKSENKHEEEEEPHQQSFLSFLNLKPGMF